MQGVFFLMAEKTLVNIQEAFMHFDFRQLVPSTKNWSECTDGNDSDVFRYWNATKLFFRRGLFNDRAFPAIWNVTIPDKTLEQCEEEDTTSEQFEEEHKTSKQFGQEKVAVPAEPP